MQADESKSTSVFAVKTTSCTESQTDALDSVTPPENLLTLAQEITRAIDVYKDADRTTLSSLRLLLGYGPFNVKLVDLIRFEHGEVIVIGKQRTRDKRDQRTCDKETHYPGILSWLIGGINSGGISNIEKWAISVDGKSPQTVQLESLSLELCTVMSLLGYGAEIRRKRVDVYRISDRLLTAMSNDIMYVTTGSKAEGLTCFLESDHDHMFVVLDVVCVDDSFDENAIPENTTVIRLNTSCTYAGHCRLLLWKLGPRVPSVVLNALCDDGRGGHLLNSDLFVSKYPTGEPQPEEVCHERAGPSMPHSFLGALHSDRVFTLRCHCPNILQRWAERPRHWPPLDIVKRVVSMGAFVTPVGFKESKHRHLEWRICFNTGETELLNNLTDTQVQIYVMLKMVVKGVLKPQNKEVTSYVLKNIVLWQAEKNAPTLFHERSLLHWLHEGLVELSNVISSKHLPYYMIPERNLMEGCGLEDEQQRSWLATITDMINEGPSIILRLHKIRQAVILYPEPLLCYSNMRTELEMLQLEDMKRSLQCMDKSGRVDDTDIILQQIWRRMDEILTDVRQRLRLEGCVVDDMKILFDRMLR